MKKPLIGITLDNEEPGVYSSGTWHMKTSDWKRSNIRFQQLDSIYKKIKNLEKIKGKE